MIVIKKPDISMMLNGAIGALVAITACLRFRYLRVRPRSPHVFFRAKRIANEAVNVNAPTETSPSACTPSWWKPPP